MKTSNKLLIAFALALIVLPLLGMIIVSRVYYKEGSEIRDEIVAIKSLDSPNEFFTNLPTNAFQSVNMTEAKGMRLTIHLVQHAKHGLKVSNHLKGRIKMSVDANGQLQVAVKGPEDENRGDYNGEIYIFSPNVKAISFNNAENINIYANQDSLQLNATNVSDIYFGDLTIVKKFDVTVDKVSLVNVTEAQIAALTIKLTEANFQSRQSSFERLSIASKGKANIDIYGEENQPGSFKIGDLAITTSDTSKVNIAGVSVKNCSGRFSDATRVEMPAVNLNQMYTPKK